MFQTNGKDSFFKQAKTERVVRLELERRHAKGTLRVIDNMIREIDDQLLYVAQFKKEWLQHRRKLEEERQKIVRDEAEKREKIEKNSLKKLYKITSPFHVTQKPNELCGNKNEA